MLRTFLISLKLYGGCFVQSFGRAGRRSAPLRWLRLCLLLVGFPLFVGLQLIHWLSFLIDELLFPSYRKVRIERPLFITGLPRSGTTFVHRTLARDVERFTSFRMWEAVFAPAIVERKCWKALAALDRRAGAPGQKLLHWAVTKATGDFAQIHAVGLEAEEEDYLALLPAGGCFILVLAFPWPPQIWKLARYQRMDPFDQAALLDFYHRCLQKHLYVEGGGRKRLLSKNAAFASWIPALARTFPDARFLICVRDPIAGLSSQLSSIKSGCELFGTKAAFADISQKFAETFSANYALLRSTIEAGSASMAVVDQEALRQAPGASLTHALTALDEPLSPAWQASLKKADQTSKGHRSAHQHSGPTQRFAKATIKPCVLEDYRVILEHRCNPESRH